MAQVRIKNLTQHRIYVPVPVGIMMRPAQEVILSEISDDLLAQSKKISRLVEKRVIQVWIQPQDPDIDDSLETRYINVGGGLPLHGATHFDGGSDPIDIDQLRTSGGVPGHIMEAGPGGSIQWVPHTVPPHAPNHADGGSDEIDVVTLGSTSAPAAGYLPASDGANGLSWVSPSAPGAHKTTHYEGGADSIDVAELSSASATGADQLVRSNGAGGLEWTSPGTPGTIQPDDTASPGAASTYSRSDHRHAIQADTPIAVTPGDPAAEGSSLAFARADHQHSMSAFAAPGTIQPDDTADAGTASSFARADHRHAIDAAAPTQGIGGGNSEGAGTSFARSSHDHTIRETGGPQDLTVGAIPEGYSVRRSGTSLVGINPYDPARTIVVATDALGADATSIAAAITLASGLSPVPSASAPATILVHPGVYTTAPFVLPNYVTLCGVGGAEAAVLQASSTTSALCTANGGSVISNLTIKGANGVGGIGIDVGGTADTLHVKETYVQDCTTGMRCSGAGKDLHIVSSEVEDGTNGVLIDATATARIDTLCVKLQTNAIRIGSTGGTIKGNNIRVISHAGETWHVLVESAASTLTLTSSEFREDRTSYHAAADVDVQHMSLIPGDEAMQLTAEFHVGTENRPCESAFGGGDSHTRGMAALTNTNLEVGTWADITTQLKDQDATSAPLFAAVGIGNCFYVGGDQQFPGIKAQVTTAKVGGTVVLEYWNGSAWVTIPHLSTDADSPYGQYAQNAFARVNNEQIRFGIEEISGWVTKSLNGIVKYWVRWRVTVALTTIPAADRVKLHTNRTEINSDGIVEYFGAAEPQRQLLWHRGLTEEMDGFAQPDLDILIATNFTLKALDNRFQNGAKDGSATFVQTAPGLDTSRPLTFNLGWQPTASNTGNAEYQLDVVTINPGDIVDGTLPYTRQLSQIVTGPFTANQLYVTSFTFTVPDLTPTGTLAIAYYRDASGANLDDTFEEDTKALYTNMFGTFWR